MPKCWITMKTENNFSELLKMIRLGENQTQDFKFEINDSKKIAKSLSAFANTDGGRLLIGVKDNGKISGINSDEEFYMIESAATLYCKPTVNFEAKLWDAEGKTVLEIYVPKGENPPYNAKNTDGKWLAYIRVGDENILADRVIYKSMKNASEKKGLKMKYTRKQDFAMKYLEEYGKISYHDLIKYLQISKFQAENILIQLLSAGLIKPVFNKPDFFYVPA